MTTTAIRPAESTATPESQRLAELDAQIAATRAELASAWGDVAAAHLARLEQARAEIVELYATSASGA